MPLISKDKMRKRRPVSSAAFGGVRSRTRYFWGTMFRFWSYRRWVFPEDVEAAEDATLHTSV